MLQYDQIQRTSRHFDLLADYSEVDNRRLIDRVTWVEKSPSSNLYPGQLPVAGLDSQWLDGRKTVLTDIFQGYMGHTLLLSHTRHPYHWIVTLNPAFRSNL